MGLRGVIVAAAAAFAVLAACRASSDTAPAAGAMATDTVREGGDWPMYGYVAARTGEGPAATGITAANAGQLQRRQVRLPGTVDSSPIYLRQVIVGGMPHDVFVVTTTYGKTLALDAATGTILWTFTPPGYDSWAGSRRITTAAPVADPDRRSVYAAAPDGQVRKLDVADGHVVWASAVTQLPAREKIASALNYDAGHVLAATGGYIGDAPPYQGHIALLDAQTGRLLSTWNSLCSDRHALIAPASCAQSGSAIWARRGIVVNPDDHRLLAATGNGLFDGATDWGDSVVELAPDASGIVGHWTPGDFQQLDESDADIGSTGPALLAGGYLVQGGKDGQLRLIQLGSLQAGTRTGGEVQSVPTPGGDGLYSDPAVMGGSWLFVADGSGTGAWRLQGGRLVKAWSNGHAGTSPVVAGGLLWVYDPGGTLRAYLPETGAVVASLPAGSGHWQSPIVSDGRVALAEGSSNDHATSGILDIYELR